MFVGSFIFIRLSAILHFCVSAKMFQTLSKASFNSEPLVHSEVYSNELGFSGLSLKILFYKRVKWFIIFFFDKIEA